MHEYFFWDGNEAYPSEAAAVKFTAFALENWHDYDLLPLTWCSLLLNNYIEESCQLSRIFHSSKLQQFWCCYT